MSDLAILVFIPLIWYVATFGQVLEIASAGGKIRARIGRDGVEAARDFLEDVQLVRRVRMSSVEKPENRRVIEHHA